MQPEPPEVSPKDSTSKSSSVSSTSSSQHGYVSDDRPPADPRNEGHWRTHEPPPSRADAPAEPDHPRERVVSEAKGDASRLTTSSPPTDRVATYETAASASSARGAEGPRLAVLKRSRRPSDTSCPIAKLPNEVLTHTLSHLPPTDLANVSLVSRRFYGLVTAPHAWRVGFARFFPGPDSLAVPADYLASEQESLDLRSERRSFTRLTAVPSWRSEYLLRTRLLRAMARGKPAVQPSKHGTRPGMNPTPSPVIMYDSRLMTTVNHLHATFGNGPSNAAPRFVHGEDEIGMASMSDPVLGKTENWGLSDPHMFAQFVDQFPGEAQWGLGPGDIVGNPNVMDVSQPHGMVHGEGRPGGLLYFRSINEMRGRYLAATLGLSLPELGVPKVLPTSQAVCSVWIAKTRSIPSLSGGLVGILSGSSSGVVSCYSLGTDGLRGRRLGRGELTARWAVSPGVPIIGLAVDEFYSIKRHAQNRVWAVALNALGEVFYLTKFPTRPDLDRGAVSDDEALERLSWTVGRSVYWNLVEPSRRDARPDPYKSSDVDGSYSPRSSWTGMCLSEEQIVSETLETNTFLEKRPKDFRKDCLGWDMRRRMEVDFAGDDGNYAGESIVVFECGLDELSSTKIGRFTRCKFLETSKPTAPEQEAIVPTESQISNSLFGSSSDAHSEQPYQLHADPPTRRGSVSSSEASDGSRLAEEWRCSLLRLGGLKPSSITTTAIDASVYASLTMSEDPALSFSNVSRTSSPAASPVSTSEMVSSPGDVPGQRARFVAAGTASGSIFMWDIRAPISRTTSIVTDVDPVRIIHTDSPQISCLGLTALCLVSGGNDGLVQMWDPLASSPLPIRTLNSRFSSRARRRLAQAEASMHGVGINMFAAGAIYLDPDPTVLRGMVSLGTHLRYWSYSASAADAYKSSKRRLRRSSGRGSNSGSGPDRGVAGKLGNLRDYIAAERLELDRDKRAKRREAERMTGRFGIDLLGTDASEEELLAYAAMLSAESLAAEEKSRVEASSPPLPILDEETSTASFSASTGTSSTSTPVPSEVGRTHSSPQLKSDDELDADIAEAIRLSLGAGADDATSSRSLPRDPDDFDVPIRYAKTRRSPPTSASRPSAAAELDEIVPSSSGVEAASDLALALELSLADEERRQITSQGTTEDFPALRPAEHRSPKGKGKDKP